MTIVLYFALLSTISALFRILIVLVYNLLSIHVNNSIVTRIVKLNIISLQFFHHGLNELLLLVDLEWEVRHIVLWKLHLSFQLPLLRTRACTGRKTINVVVLRVTVAKILKMGAISSFSPIPSKTAEGREGAQSVSSEEVIPVVPTNYPFFHLDLDDAVKSAEKAPIV